MAKPRMVKSDAWRNRKCVVKYWEYKRQVQSLGIKLPEAGAHVTFVLPMPASWSQKKKNVWNSSPHQQKPDIDNLLKGILDCIYKDDSVVWNISATKRWGKEGRIIINNGSN